MEVLFAPIHWLHMLGLALWVGSLTMLLHVLRGRRIRPEDIELLERARRRARVVALWSVVALLVTLAADVGLTALDRAGGDVGAAFSGSGLRALLFDSRYGVASVARWLLLVASLWAAGEFGRDPESVRARAPRPSRHALGIVAPAWHPPVILSRDAWTWVAAVLAAGVLLCAAIAGPYGATPLAAVIEALHLAATLLWLGGTVVLVVTLVPFIPLVEGGRRPLAVLARLNRFTPVALLGAVGLVVTGAWEATHAGAAPRLGVGRHASTLATLAGVSVLAKTLLLLAIVVVSARSLLGLRRRLQQVALRARRNPSLSPRRDLLLRLIQRALKVNAVLAVLALLCGAIADLYPRQALAAVAARDPAGAIGQAGGTTVLLRATPGGLGGANLVDLYLSDASGQPVSGPAVTVAARSLEARGGEPPAVAAVNLGGGHYRARLPLAIGGHWRIAVGIRSGTGAATAIFSLTAPAPLTIGAGAVPSRTTASGDWQERGPVLITHALAAAPDNHALLYEGTIEGVYRSDDGGAHWAAASDGLTEAAREVWSLSFLPDRSLIAATGAGVYRSTDGARHWRAAGLDPHAIYTLAAHLAGHVVLLAGGDGGIYRSDDAGTGTGSGAGGIHWRQVYDSGAASVTSLAWPSLRPAFIVAGINPGRDARGMRSVVVSADGGASWAPWVGGLPADANVMSVAVAPGGRVVYAGSLNRGAYVASMARTGATATWQGRDTGLPADAQVGSFAFDPANPAILYAATTDGVYRSPDAGAHWRLFGRGLRGDATVVTALTLVSGRLPALYAATAAGLYRRVASKR